MDQHCRNRHHAAGVKQRQIDHVAVVAGEKRRRHRHLMQMHIGRHHALRRTGRAGRENDRLHIPWCDRPFEHRRLVVAAVQCAGRMNNNSVERTGRAAQDDDLAHRFAVDVVEAWTKVGVRDHQPRLRKADRMLEQRAAIGGVDRYEHGAEIVETEPDAHAVGAVRQPDKHALTLLDAERAQCVGGANGFGLHVGVSPLLAVGEDGEDLIRLLARPALDHVTLDALLRPRHARVQMIVHDPSSLTWRVVSCVPCLARRRWPWRFRRTGAFWSASCRA